MQYSQLTTFLCLRNGPFYNDSGFLRTFPLVWSGCDIS